MSEIKTIISNNILPVELRDIPTIMKGDKGDPGRDGSFTQKAYKTYASMVADKGNIPTNTSVLVNNDPDKDKNAFYTYDGSVFTKSNFDPQGILTTVDVRLNQAVESASEYFQSQVVDTVATAVATSIDNSTVAYNQAIEVTKGQWANTISTTDADIKANSEAYLATIPGTVNDAINNTAVEGGVLADTFVTVNNSINQRQVNMGFSDINTIKAISNANIGMRVYSIPHASNFIFKAASTSPVNDGTVLQGIGGIWEMEDKPAYYASWFATANVEEDQSLKLQAGLDYATSKGASFIIDDTYWVKANQSLLSTNGNALLLRTNSLTAFTPKGHLKLITENSDSYNMILARQIDNYVLIRPKLTGDRRTNKVGSGEWGYGLTIYESSNGYIEKPYISDMWGDGLYIGKAWRTTSEEVPKNITIMEPWVSGCRRNGISFTSGDNVKIIRPYVEKVGDYDGIVGTFPKAGIDVEPESGEGLPRARIVNSLIEEPTIKDCYAGLYVYAFQDDLTLELHVKGLTTLDGISTTGVGFFHGGANGKGLVLIDKLYYKTPVYSQFSVSWNKMSNLYLLIESIDHRVAGSFVIGNIVRGELAAKVFGNMTINNLLTLGFTAVSSSADNTYLIDGYKIFMDKAAKTRIGIYQETTNYASLGGADTYLQSDGAHIHTEFSASSKTMPNEIWMDPSIDAAGTTAIYLSTEGDYRELKVTLSHNTTVIGEGCNINGIAVNTATGVKTQARTTTLGAWIRFQNTEGGKTRVLSSYGEWAFS